MAIGLSATRRIIDSKVYTAKSAIPEGAVCVHGAADDEVTLPGAALASRVAGVSINAGTTASDGTETVTLAKLGQAPVLLGAGLTIARGDELVVANTSGHVRKRVAGDAAGAVIGQSETARTAGGSAPEFINATIRLYEIVGL